MKNLKVRPNRTFGRSNAAVLSGIALATALLGSVALPTALADGGPGGPPAPPKECGNICNPGDADVAHVKALITVWGVALQLWESELYKHFCNCDGEECQAKCKAWQKWHGQLMAANFYCKEATLLPTVGKLGLYKNTQNDVLCPRKTDKTVCPWNIPKKCGPADANDCPNTIAQYFACDFLPKFPKLLGVYDTRACVADKMATYEGLYVFELFNDNIGERVKVGARFSFVLVKSNPQPDSPGSHEWRILHHHSSADPKFLIPGDVTGDGKVGPKDLQATVCNWGLEAPPVPDFEAPNPPPPPLGPTGISIDNAMITPEPRATIQHTAGSAAH